MTSKRRPVINPATDLMLAPFVVAMRLPIMVSETLTGAGGHRRESDRAVAEKATALADGIIVAQLAMPRVMVSAWLGLASGKSPAAVMTKAADTIIGAATRPAARTVRANYERLSKPQRNK
jgi:hypothetical protein